MPIFFMKIKNFSSIFAYAFLAVVISFTSCKKEELLTLSPTNQSITKDAGSFTINVTSNTSWTVTSNQSWMTVGTASGEDNGVITVTYQENATTSSRSGNITVTTKDGMVQVVTVAQAGIPPVTNPFVGSWKDAAYSNNSYELITFNADMTIQIFFYDGSDGTSSTDTGTYNYSETTKIITMLIDGVPNAVTYNFVNATTLVIGDYTYFKQ